MLAEPAASSPPPSSSAATQSPFGATLKKTPGSTASGAVGSPPASFPANAVGLPFSTTLKETPNSAVLREGSARPDEKRDWGEMNGASPFAVKLRSTGKSKPTADMKLAAAAAASAASPGFLEHYMRVIDASCQISREFNDVLYKTRQDGAGAPERAVVFEARAAEDTAETVGRAAAVSAEGVVADAPDASEPVGEQALPEEEEALQTTATAMKESESELSEDARAVPTFADALAPVSSYERRLAGLSGMIQGKERDNLLALTSSALTQQPGPGTAPTSSSSNSGLICIYTYTLSTSALKSVSVCKQIRKYICTKRIHT